MSFNNQGSGWDEDYYVSDSDSGFAPSVDVVGGYVMEWEETPPYPESCEYEEEDEEEFKISPRLMQYYEDCRWVRECHAIEYLDAEDEINKKAEQYRRELRANELSQAKKCAGTSKATAFRWLFKALKAGIEHHLNTDGLRQTGPDGALLDYTVLQPTNYGIRRACRAIRKLSMENGPTFKALNKIMLVFSEKKQLTDARKEANEELLELLQKQLSAKFRGWSLTPYGGSHNGFGEQGSDMDISLHKIKQFKKETTVTEVAKIFNAKKNRMISKMRKHPTVLEKARVPLVKMVFDRNGTEMEVDLSIGNELGAKNTKYLKLYSLFDPRVVQLNTIIKHWAKHHGLHGGKDRCFNTYSIVILVINYLQKGVRPAMLPHIAPDVAETLSTEQEMEKYVKNLKFDPKKQKMTLAELVVGFMTFYAVFDSYEWQVDIRTLDIPSRYNMTKNEFDGHAALNILCPVGGQDPTRNVSVYCHKEFKKAIDEFNELVWIKMAKDGKMDHPEVIKTLGIN
ncbi:unnamed protein product [Bursaphelenchus okinawaensis]|uniref:Poly(A) RNA polymerase mitochondrial-like central palm domain-containing protein n=1 Tax=Bursaphelenchus okinawaensis TaxID=465554 RepID=A0A811JRI0_9BILA|nr:unnamed protein product [Bursaphelenchus okinawaensis]CAG9080220.1 unnamed protein product [Bursaphelenchus okinawaensis]